MSPDNLTGVAVDTTPIAVVQPTFLYELLWNLAVAALVVWADRRFRLSHGRAFALYVAGYTAGRFVIELLRTDPATRVFGDVRINVVVSAVVFVGAVIYMIVNRGRPREVFGRDADRFGRRGPGYACAPWPAPTAPAIPTRTSAPSNEVEARSKEKSPAAERRGQGWGVRRQQRRRGARRPGAGTRAGRAGGAPVARHELTHTSPAGLPRAR